MDYSSVCTINGCGPLRKIIGLALWWETVKNFGSGTIKFGSPEAGPRSGRGGLEIPEAESFLQQLSDNLGRIKRLYFIY